METINNMDIQELWSAACCGDNETLRKYYAANGEVNRRYYSLFAHHSLIAGACRNGMMDTVDLLLQNGETVLDSERYEFREVFYRQVVLAATKLVNHMKDYNYNLSKRQRDLVGDLAVAIYELRKEG